MTVRGARWRWGLAALTASLGSCGAAPDPVAPAPPPAKNVILVVVDTLRADALGLYGYGRATSPFLDRFATERAVVFDAARSTAPWTKPSVASILTGLDPRHHRVTLHHERLHTDSRTLAEVFAEAGFQTACFQSNLLLASLFGYDQGFELYGEDQLASHAQSTGAELNAAALHWLREERDASRPFFLYVHHYEPHFDYLRPGDDFADEPYTGRLRGTERMDELIAATSLLRPEDVAYLRSKYDAEVRYQDELLEEFFGGVDELGLSSDTALVFTADHGEEFLEHGELSHQHKLFDELLHVPLWIARPGEPQPGRRIAEPVSLVDLGRTILDLAGQRGREFPGQSLAPVLDGGTRSGGLVLAHARTIPNVPDSPNVPDNAGGTAPPAARDMDMALAGPWKLIRDFHTGTRQLYRVDRDPGERDDLAAREPGRVQSLERRLDEWLVEHDDLDRERAAEVIELDDEMLQKLEDLGYL